MSDELKKGFIVFGAFVFIAIMVVSGGLTVAYFDHVERMACIERPNSPVCETVKP